MNDAVKKETLILLGLVVSYGTFYFLNNALTEALYVVPGAHLVHLPSGLKVFIVMITGLTGAMAIALVGFLWSVLYMFKENYLLTIPLSIVSGLVPWLTLALLRKKIQLSRDLSNLDWKKLLVIVFTFALLNSVCLQLIVYSFGESTSLMNGIWVMLVGDITGIFIVIYSLRFVMKLLEILRPRLTDHSMRRTQ
jgi:hypothetical protein